MIWGDKDTDTPLYMGKIMESEIKDSGLVVLEGTGHFSYLDDMDKFAIIIRNFLHYNKVSNDWQLFIVNLSLEGLNC